MNYLNLFIQKRVVLGLLAFLLGSCGKTESDLTASSGRSENTSDESLTIGLTAANLNGIYTGPTLNDIYDCGTDKGVVDVSAKLTWRSSTASGSDVNSFFNTVSEISPKMAQDAALHYNDANVKFFCNLKGYANGKATHNGLFVGLTALRSYIYKWDADARTFNKHPATSGNKTLTGIQCSQKLAEQCRYDRRWVFLEDNRKILFPVKTDVKYSSWRLSQNRSNFALATVGDKLFIAGGRTTSVRTQENGPCDSAPSDAVDIYNASKGKWSSTKLPVATDNPQIVSIGSQLFFYQRPQGPLNVYDSTSGSWTNLNLPGYFQADWFVALQEKLIFGASWRDQFHVYDTITKSWSKISVPIAQVMSKIDDNRVIITKKNNSWQLDAATLRWQMTGLNFNSNKDGFFIMKHATVGDNLFICSYLNPDSSQLQVFNKDLKLLYNEVLPGKSCMNATLLKSGNQLAVQPGTSAIVDLFNPENRSWLRSVGDSITTSRGILGYKNIIIFAGGEDPRLRQPSSMHETDAIDFFDSAAKKWTSGRLSSARENPVLVEVGNKVLAIGGSIKLPWGDPTFCEKLSDAIDILEFD